MARLTSLLVVLWVGVTVGSVVDLQKRIIGGKPCSVTERGYHAFLTITNGTDDFICGGSLIDKQWILTAAHCWKDGWTVTAVFGRDPLSKTIVEIEPTPWIFKDKDDKTKKHDIMLLKLLKPATGIDPVPLPVSIDCVNKPTKGKTVQIAGYYSKTKPGYEHAPDHLDTSEPLQCAKTTVVDCDVTTCPPVNDAYTRPLTQSLCYQDWHKKVDATPGDSGGGVVYAGKIYGVHVTSDDEACAGPGQAMDVCSYMKWILETIDPKSSG